MADELPMGACAYVSLPEGLERRWRVVERLGFFKTLQLSIGQAHDTELPFVAIAPTADGPLACCPIRSTGSVGYGINSDRRHFYFLFAIT